LDGLSYVTLAVIESLLFIKPRSIPLLEHTSSDKDNNGIGWVSNLALTVNTWSAIINMRESDRGMSEP